MALTPLILFNFYNWGAYHLITENWSRTSAPYLLASKRIIPRVAALSVCRSGHFIPRRPHTAKHFPASLIREQSFCPSKPRKGMSKRFKGVYKMLVWRASEPKVCHPDRPFRCASVFVVPLRASLVGWSCLLGKNQCLDIPPLLSIVGLSPIAGNIPRLAFILFCRELGLSPSTP